ncbi:hypothetical protein GPALN_011243 [Globodera pallida]|nr:hypothetical protein GPALN_011243 [Globodera pallida]
MVEGGITLVKYLLFFANFILWVLGLAFLVSGIVLQLKYTGLLDILGDERLATPVLLLAIGCLCTLLGFVGYCGAIRENYCLTVSFAVLLALLLLAETAIAILVYALHEPLNVTLINQLTQGMRRYNNSKGVLLAWNQVQRQLHCCGVNNATDWKTYAPDSCCVHFHDGCARMAQPLLYEMGCVQAVQHWIVTNATVIGCASALLGALQIIGICFACCLSKNILKDFHDFYY